MPAAAISTSTEPSSLTAFATAWRRAVPDVGYQRKAPAANGPYCAGRLLQLLSAARLIGNCRHGRANVQRGDVSAFLSQPQRAGPADTAGRAGHHGHPVGNPARRHDDVPWCT